MMRPIRKQLIGLAVAAAASLAAVSAPAYASAPTVFKREPGTTFYPGACGTYSVLATDLSAAGSLMLSQDADGTFHARVTGTTVTRFEAADSEGTSLGGPSVEFRQAGGVFLTIFPEDQGLTLTNAGRSYFGVFVNGRIKITIDADGNFSAFLSPNTTQGCDLIKP